MKFLQMYFFLYIWPPPKIMPNFATDINYVNVINKELKRKLSQLSIKRRFDVMLFLFSFS